MKKEVVRSPESDRKLLEIPEPGVEFPADPTVALGLGPWNSYQNLEGATSDAVTWVTLGSILIPDNQTLFLFASIIGDQDVYPPLPGGPVAGCYGFWSQWIRHVDNPVAVLVTASAVWTSGSASGARQFTNDDGGGPGKRVFVQVQGTAATDITWSGKLFVRSA